MDVPHAKRKRKRLFFDVRFEHFHGLGRCHILALARAHYFPGVLEENGTGLKARNPALRLKLVERQSLHRPKALFKAILRAATFPAMAAASGSVRIVVMRYIPVWRFVNSR